VSPTTLATASPRWREYLPAAATKRIYRLAGTESFGGVSYPHRFRMDLNRPSRSPNHHQPTDERGFFLCMSQSPSISVYRESPGAEHQP
jgi:hypothetical protein